MSEHFLDRADIVVGLQKMGGEGMAAAAGWTEVSSVIFF
jgi:hypothetical protein